MEQPAASAETASSSTDGVSPLFDQAGRLALRRVLLRRVLGGLRKAFWPLLIALGGLAVWAALGGGRGVGGLALAMLAAVVVGVVALVWRRRPSPYAALALWDRQTGRREAFAAAWWFEGLPSRTQAETAHYLTQMERLPAALRRLPDDLPLPRWQPLLALPAICLFALWGGWRAEARARGPELTAAMVEKAAEQARAVAALEKQAEALTGLTDEEQARLQKQLREAAELLEQSDGKTARELLDALEGKARETEKLAQRLAAQGDAWASPELTEALRRQADTADLGDAVADQQAQATGEAADALAGKLDEADGELAERLQEVLQSAQQASQPEDGERPVGAAVAAGAEALQAGRAADAVEAMRELARQMRELDGQRQTQQAMQQLAQQLRDAGSQVAGAEAGQSMAAVANPQEQGAQGGASQGQGGQQEQPALTPGESQPSQAGEMAMAAAGQEGEPGGSPGQNQPGEAPPAMLGERSPGAGRGDGQPDPGAPMLLAPVPPGAEAGEKPPEMAVIMPGGAAGGGVVPGAGAGLPPGTGSPELKAGEGSDPATSSQQALVNAQSSREGASMLRQVEGGAPKQDEVAQSGGAALTVEFLEAQEAALDEAALPPARREQVRRYFNALRQRLEGQR